MRKSATLAHPGLWGWLRPCLCHERETLLKLTFFQLMERYRSWGSVLVSIYRLDAHDLKKTEVRMRQSDKKKKRLRSSMNST